MALVTGGSHSELEIRGYLDVFDVRELRGLVRQYPVRVEATTYWLDLADERSKTAIELDGAVAHGLPAQRERDARRDARLAALGWLTLRFTPERLVLIATRYAAKPSRPSLLALLAVPRVTVPRDAGPPG